MSKIAIVAPAPIKGSGGVARIYTFIQALGHAGYNCHVYIFDHNGRSVDCLLNLANEYYSTSNFSCHTSLDELTGIYDLSIATRWDTTSLIMKINTKQRAYLIQDYEVYFNPIGDSSVSAENSYMFDMHTMTYGRWLALKLKSDFNKNPYYFDFASDTQVFKCNRKMEDRLDDRPSIAFVYQDDKPRRCPILGIEALGIVKHYRPGTKIYFVGSSRAPTLWYEFENVGNLNINMLNELYNKCHVGLSLSSTNPSCNSFDMMAAGLPSVDLYRENNLFDVPDQGVLLAHQTQESIAEAILHLIDNTDELIERSKFGIEFMKSRPRSKEVEDFVEIVHSIIGHRALFERHNKLPNFSYSKPPVVAEVYRNSSVDAYLKAQSGFRDTLSELDETNTDKYYYTNVLYQRTSDDKLYKGELREIAKARRHRRIVNKIYNKFHIDKLIDKNLFEESYYLENNPDVAASGMDPFDHFVLHGAAEGRSPSPFFDPAWYSKEYADIIPPSLSQIAHYILYGSANNLAPNSVFEPNWYSAKYPDVKTSGLHPLLHYITIGELEERDPSDVFSSSWYLRANPDVAVEGLSPLRHYLIYGRKEGRTATRPGPTHRKENWEISSLWSDIKEVDIYDLRLPADDLEPKMERDKRIILDTNSRYRRVSFDVWSTILHRRCHPDEIKLRSARLLLLLARDYIRPAYRNPTRMMNARMHAENASAPKGDFEYRFEDAIALWFDNVLSAACDDTTKSDLANALLEHEFQAELDVIEVDENIANEIRQLTLAPIFVSDFYMRSSFIKNLLDRVGIGSSFARGYSSCDTFENKRLGSLFKRVIKELEVSPNELLHIGDNLVSDFERPQAMGIAAIPYVSHADEARQIWYTEAFDRLRGGNNGFHHRRMLALVQEQVENHHSANSLNDFELFRTGCSIGILAFGFCLNVMQDAISRKVKEVVFFAREGILFKQIYDAIAQHEPFNIAAPPSKVLYVSRRATFAASLKSFDNTELMNLWTMYWKQSPIGFAKSLNLDLQQVSDAASRLGIELELVVEAPWENSAFQKLLNDTQFREHATSSITIQRDILRAYIEQEIAIDRGSIFICDIGWRGTIQDNISKVLGIPIVGHYLALQRFLNEQPAGSSKVAWLSDENIDGSYLLPNQPAPFEMIFNGPGGSTIGYRENTDGRIEPIREVHDGEEVIVASLEPCRSGMMAIIPSLARYIKIHGLVANDILPLNWKVADDFIKNPPRVVADLFGRLEHNESFGVGLVEAMEEVKFKDIVSFSTASDIHQGLLNWLGVRWPQGMSRQSVLKQWWDTATPNMKRFLPREILKVYAPAVLQGRGSSVSIYLPEPAPNSGGQRTAINLIKALVEIGFNAELYIENIGKQGDVVESYLGNTRAEIFSGWSTRRTNTVAIATVAHSAQYISSKSSSLFNCYLVQDFEALFHPLNSAYIKAESSYASGLNHLTIGNWLSHLLNNKYGVPAQPSGFGVDTCIYNLRSEVRREKAIGWLYQPEKPWRANGFALDVISAVKKRHPDAKIYVFGSEEIPKCEFDFEHLGLINNPKLLNELYNRCQVGICFGLSNPSRIPFEMAAAGCRTVDLYRYNNLMDHFSDMSVLAYQSENSVAEAVCNLLSSYDTASGMAQLLSENVRSRTLDWEKDALVANVMNVISGDVTRNEKLLPTYKESPFFSQSDDSIYAREFCRRQLAAAEENFLSDSLK